MNLIGTYRFRIENIIPYDIPKQILVQYKDFQKSRPNKKNVYTPKLFQNE